MWTLAFWKATAERAIRTFAQVLLGTGLAGKTGVVDVDWQAALSVAGLSTLASVLMSVASTAVSDGPGLTETPKTAVTVDPPGPAV